MIVEWRVLPYLRLERKVEALRREGKVNWVAESGETEYNCKAFVNWPC